MHWLIDFAEVKITVTAETRAAEQLVRIALADMRASPVSEVVGTQLTAAGEENAWRLTDHSTGKTRAPKTSGGLIYQLTDRVIHHVAAAAVHHHCVHAAAVSCQGQAIIMPAHSGSGKSLLTAWLVANGFDYITDELILIDDEYGIGGIARPIQIKKKGMPAAKHLIRKGDGVLAGVHSNTVPIASFGGRASPRLRHAAGLVLFPEFRPGSGYALTPLDAAEAGMKIFASHINARNLPGHGFGSLMELVRITPCYTLHYGGFAELPEDFASRVRSLLEPG